MQAFRQKRSRQPRAERAKPCASVAAAWCLALLGPSGGAAAPVLPMPIVIEQGSDVAAVITRDGELIAQLAGRLWRLPVAGGEARPITPATERVRRPALSPDGSTLAFEAWREGRVQVLLADAEGGSVRALTTGPWNHSAPAWSPDGRNLALSSDRGGDAGIWQVDVASGAMSQLTFESGAETDPAFDPTGDGFAYTNQRAGRGTLVLQRRSRAPRVLAAHDGPVASPSWRPDGSVITYVAAGASGPRLNMVILSEPPVLKALAPQETASPHPAAWLDRNQLVYGADGRIRRRDFAAPSASVIPFRATIEVGARPPQAVRRLPDAGTGRPAGVLSGIAPLPDGRIVGAALGDLWEIDAGGQLLRTLTSDAWVDREPAASADGRRLAFISDRSGSAQIWLLDLATRELGQATTGPTEASHPAWSPAGDRLAYLATETSPAAGAVLSVITPGKGPATEIATNLDPAGRPAWSPDGTQLGLVDLTGGSPRLLLFSADGKARRRLTLPVEAARGRAAMLEWSPDGKQLLVASEAGLRVLPVLSDGFVGVEWRSLVDTPVHAARWTASDQAIVFADDQGLGHVTATGPGTSTRIPLALSRQVTRASGRATIRAGRVFDGSNDGYLYNQDVVVEDGRIVAVRPWNAEPLAPGERLVEARGKLVMPGLIDLALDLTGASGERPGRALLAYGVTTALGFGATESELRDIAERWQAHGAGPRLLGSTAWCDAGPDTPGAAPALAMGAAQLCSGGAGQVARLAGAARDRDLAVWSADWLSAATGGIDAISLLAAPDSQHGFTPGYYQDAVDVVIHSGSILVPGLASRGLPWLIDEDPDLLRSRQQLALFRAEERDAQRRSWREIAAMPDRARYWLRDRQRLVGRIDAGGGAVAAGSGTGAGAYGLGLHAEIRLLARSGLRPAAAMRAATATAAKSLGLQEELGRVAPGQRADLLLIDGDPLRDLADLLRIEATIVGGRLRSASELLGTPTQALEKFTPPGSDSRAKPRRSRR